MQKPFGNTLGSDAIRGAPASGRSECSGDGGPEVPKIPFFSQGESFTRLWPLIEQKLTRVFDNGKFSHGQHVTEFEQELAAYTGAEYTIGVNSGTDALVLLLRACGVRPGDGVLVPSYSFFATASSVVLAGGRPQFVDVDPVNYAMTPSGLAEAVTPESRFVMPAHLFHGMADMPALCDAAQQAGLTMLEDSAEAIGMRREGVHAGLHGVGGVLSFFPSKTLGALGDAGAVLTDDPAIAERVSALRHHGRGGNTMNNFPAIATASSLPGANSKMDDIQAAVLSAKMTVLDEDIARRARLAAAYTEQLRHLPGVVRLPEAAGRGPEDSDVYYVYLIEAEQRDALAAHLERCGVGTETYYPLPLPLQPAFADLGYRPGDFPCAERAANRALALPLYPDLTLAQVDRVCEAVGDFYRARAPRGDGGNRS